MTWSVSEAKAKLSALLAKTRRGPQVIENRGEEVAVVLSVTEYQRLLALEAQPRKTPMQAYLESLEQLRSRGDLSLELPPRRLVDDREPLTLDED
ncbi:MAG: type II toxin-antitoxin system Phd/YefM family antitoxin [Myxococcaceae bacterium]|nr:type II toxin-antitoxin system Phd/YefM family antitoxin [Myxococcaceae bacterium]